MALGAGEQSGRDAPGDAVTDALYAARRTPCSGCDDMTSHDLCEVSTGASLTARFRRPLTMACDVLGDL